MPPRMASVTLEPALLGAQILLVWTPECILTTSAGIPRPRLLSRTGSAAMTSILASPPTACPMDWMLEQNVEWTLHRDMLVCVLLLMAVLMESVELQLPPPQPLAQQQHQQPLQPRQVPPQHQRPQHQQRLLPPPPPSPALPQDQHVGLLPLVQWEVPTVVPMLMEHLTIVQLAL